MEHTKEKDEIMTDVNAAVPSKSKNIRCARRCWNGIDTKMDLGSRDTIGGGRGHVHVERCAFEGQDSDSFFCRL